MRTILALLLSCSVALGQAWTWRDIAFLSSSKVSLIQSIITEASTTPTITKMTLRGSENAIRVWTGEQTVSEPYFYLYVVRNGGTALKVQLYRWSARIIACPVGATVALGTADGRTLAVSAVTFPATLATPSGSTGTANCDMAGPPIWSPTAGHVTLPQLNQAFQIASNGSVRNVYIREWDGVQWTPARLLRIEANRNCTDQATYRTLAFATWDGSTVAVTAPTGSVIGGTSQAASLSIPTPSTFLATNVASLNSAIASVVSGQGIAIAPGTYVMTNDVRETNFVGNIAAGHKGMEGITIFGQTGNRDDVVISCSTTNLGNWSIDDTSATGTAAFKALTFAFTNTAALLRAYNGHWEFENIKVYGPNTNGADLWEVGSLAGHATVDQLLFCVCSNSYSDCWNSAGTSGDVAKFYGCTGSVAGASASDQVLTSHSGMTNEVYGCNLSDATQNVIANDTTASKTFLFDTTISPGSRHAGTVDVMSFACSISGITTGDTIGILNPGYALLSLLTDQLFRFSSAVPSPANLEHNLLIGTTSLSCFFPSVTFSNFNFNICNKWANAIRCQSSSGPGTVTVIGNTCSSNTTALAFGDANLTEVFINSACRINNTGISIGSGENGRKTDSSNTIDPAISVGYTPGPGTTTNVDAALDTNWIPVGSGNCDGTGDTTAVDYVGSSDPFGLVLIYKASRLSRGAREIPAVYSSADIYPDIW